MFKFTSKDSVSVMPLTFLLNWLTIVVAEPLAFFDAYQW